MGKAIYKAQDKMKAVLIQAELRSEGIETIVVHDTSPSNSTAFIGLLMGTTSNDGWQVVAHNEDAERAINFLKMREEETGN